jgi:ABC-type nitrate/sulfonate/bicarbonate transport system substrate-binding protein
VTAISPASPALRLVTPEVLRLGYVPLADAAPLIIADALGLFAEQGLRVALSPERSWAALRDKLAFGGLDAAHMLGPLAIALALGADGIRRRLTVLASLARNGNTLTLSPALAVDGGAADLASRLRQRAEAGMPPPTLAVVYPWSSHNYLLRHALAAGGLDPDREARLVVVPPALVARALAEGEIEGFCAGEPWGSAAEGQGAGRILLGTGAIWPRHPEKVLALAEGVAERDPDLAIAATGAIIAAALWLADPANHPAAAELLRERAFPGLPHAVIARALDPASPAGLSFGETCPHPEEAAWWLGAMRRWGHVPRDADQATALAPWRPDLWQEAARQLGAPAPLPPSLPPFQPEEPFR